ncbi:hypothetical protein [Marinobacter sp. W-8]|uniref:hypothetical protein n=1 Tax=Marinobacter sp. W-8 TaxID=3369658 RepID=UPI0037C658BA
MIVFVHIPKTAGTSFSKALDKKFGAEHVAYDFGSAFSRTSRMVTDHLYGKHTPELWSMRREMEAQGVKVLSGHFPAKKYSTLFPLTQFATFLRDPVQRFYSEFCHRKRRDFDRFEGDFDEYCKDPRFRNVQSSYLAGVPWAALGFIGITEQYAESIEFFSRLFGAQIERLSLNKNSEKGRQLYDLTPEELELARAVNQKDINLYEAVKRYFNELRRVHGENEHIVKGQFHRPSDNRISGYAFYDDPRFELADVELDILVDGETVAQCKSNEYRQRLHCFGLPKRGFVGFSAELSIPSGASVEVVCSDTGQRLAGSVYS